ncbi:MAG TPA: PBP1A family penicillin-binding protein [Candidatus Marinimicrobia bacterium]|nr:PBP1A family penicillin-binding protein [Candidatus Neomarinimicrobiota bacterium]
MIKAFFRRTVLYMWLSVGLILIGSFIAGFILFYLNADTPGTEKLEVFNPDLSSRVYDHNGEILKEFYTQHRIYVELDSIPKHVVQALLATEDREFYQHWGFNLKRTIMAALVRYGGASTISQQLARSLYLSQERSYSRKLKELLTSIKIERAYTKDEILEMYMNTVYFGHGVYGIEAASRMYFSKPVKELTVDEGAMLIAVLPAPAPYSPINHYERAMRRRNLVMQNMLRDNFLTPFEYTKFLQDTTVVSPSREVLGQAPYFTEMIRLELNSVRYRGESLDIYTDGLEIHTSLDAKMQKYAELAMEKQLALLQKRLDNRLLKDRKELEQLLGRTFHDSIPNDSLYAWLPANKKVVQGAFIALDVKTGAIRALIGGKSFAESKFNRAWQAKRQPGSTFKPILYTAAIDNGYTPATQLLNQPVVLINPDGSRWTPNNYDLSTGGLTTLREAVRRSLNLVSIRVIQNLVRPEVVVDYAKKMGISTYMPAVDALALGAGSVLLREIVAAYSIFPNEGVHNKPFAITKALDRRGKEIYRSPRESKEVLSKETSYIMTNILQSVIDEGTGGRIRWYYKFDKPAAGKTGTTNDFTDAWFIGFTSHLSAGVWVGMDDPAVSLGKGQAGAVAALPIWGTFMKMAYDSLGLPAEEFERPPGVVEATICSVTKKVPTEFCPTEKEIFNIKHLPQEECDVHLRNRVNRGNSVDF